MSSVKCVKITLSLTFNSSSIKTNFVGTQQINTVEGSQIKIFYTVVSFLVLHSIVHKIKILLMREKDKNVTI